MFPSSEKFSPDTTGLFVPEEPTTPLFETREGGLNQTHELQNMTWQVQQEKKGGGESQCELIELRSAKNTMWAERGD